MKLDPDWFKTIAEIRELWPQWSTNETQLSEWSKALGRANQEVVRLAVSRHYRDCNYREPRLSAVLKGVAWIMRERAEAQHIDVAEAFRIKLARHDAVVQRDGRMMRADLMQFPAELRIDFLRIARAMCSPTLADVAFQSGNANVTEWSDAAVGLSWAAMKCGATSDDTKTREGRKRIADLANDRVMLLDQLESKAPEPAHA